jgi:iron complex outermembrane receptor protein
MLKLISLLTGCIICVAALAQSGNNAKLVVTIVNHQQKGLENATVELLKAKDSSLVKATIADAAGTAVFEKIDSGFYLLAISMTGYENKLSAAFGLTVGGTKTLDPIVLALANTTNTKEVVVTGRKPFIQKLTDRIVVNVDNSIMSAGSSAFDVLEKSPGVLIDPNDNLSLRGRQGVIIMIDGKITPMSGTDLVNYLKGLPSNSIERIDIITNPSAKYDAAGNSGIIDIRMKKDQRLGMNGTLTAGYGQGVFPKANGGATFNYRNKKVNIYGNYNHAYRKGLNHLFLKREFFKNGLYDGAYDQDNYIKIPYHTNTARLGADFFVSKKTIIGVVASANFSSVNRSNTNSSLVLDRNKLPESSFSTNTKEKSNYNNLLGNINIKHTFDSTGKEFTADVDYGVYNNGTLSNFVTGFYAIDGSSIKPLYKLNGDQQGKITIATAKADYTHPMAAAIKIETGIKGSRVETDNDVVFIDNSNAQPVYDSSKSNHFNYKETNLAAYINFNKEFKKLSLMAGLRAEQTFVKGVQHVTDVSFDSSYLQLFPSLFLNYKLKEGHAVGISVSRRIDRPNYSELNPFRFFLDPSTYSSGNPYLKPQLTWSYELTYALQQINFTLGYSRTKDNTTVVIRPSETEDKVTIQVPVNLTSYDYYGLTVSAPVKIAKWWNTVNNLNIFYGHYNGNLASTNLDNGTPSINATNNNTFMLGNEWTAELNAGLYSGGRYGFMVTKPQWFINAGVQKTLLNKKGTIRLSVTDIFWTNVPKAEVLFTNYIENWHAQRDTRVTTLTFTYRFGKTTVAASRRRTTASEEERNRAGS